MQSQKTLILLFILISLSFYQLKRADAETELILNATPLNGLGTLDYFPDQGKTLNLKIGIGNVAAERLVDVYITILDCEKVPVGFTSLNNCALAQGSNTLEASIRIASYAYVGLGNLIIEVKNTTYPCALTLQVYIQEGWRCADFDENEQVDMSDITHFVDSYIAFTYKRNLHSNCDLDYDGDIDFKDIVVFVDAYALYNKR